MVGEDLEKKEWHLISCSSIHKRYLRQKTYISCGLKTGNSKSHQPFYLVSLGKEDEQCGAAAK